VLNNGPLRVQQATHLYGRLAAADASQHKALHSLVGVGIWLFYTGYNTSYAAGA
jgi:hypothetical protein